MSILYLTDYSFNAATKLDSEVDLDLHRTVLKGGECTHGYHPHMREELIDGTGIRKRSRRIIIAPHGNVTFNAERILDCLEVVTTGLADDDGVVAVPILNEVGELRCCER